MNGIFDFFSAVGENIITAFRQFGWRDLIDILVVSVLLYYLFCFIRTRRAGKLALGVCVLLLAYVVSNILDLSTMLFFMDYIFQMGIVALVIIFQPELRSVLEKMGGESISNIRNNGNKDARVISDLCSACCALAKDKVGALIVLERSTKLGDILTSGTVLDATLSAPLLCNIFQDKAPLHDGAVVVRDGRVLAAGCFLPLTSNQHISKDLGTRHRSAVGMSETSDAVIIVVSEETGTISVACNGNLTRNYDYVALQRELTHQMGEKKGTAKRESRWHRLMHWLLHPELGDAGKKTNENGEIVQTGRVFAWCARAGSLLLAICLWVFATTTTVTLP